MYEIPLIRTQCATASWSRAPVTGVGVPPGTFLRTLCATDPGSWASSTGVGVPPGTFLGTQCATDLPGYEYLARKPASTGSVTPVTNRESSQASQATAAEMSLGSSHGIGSRFSAVNGLAEVVEGGVLDPWGRTPLA
jgi:hypothetical protein